MNEKLNDAVTAIITKTLDGVDASVAFMQSELPDYVMQLLLWHGIKSFSLVLLAVLCTTIVAVGLPYAFIQIKNNKWYIDGVGEYVLSVAAGIFFICVALSNFNLTWLQIWIAPKVWLVEYAAGLIK